MKRVEHLNWTIEYLQKHGKITGKEAYKYNGNMRLAATIYQIKKKGYVIRTEDTEGVNMFGEKYNYATYYLEDGVGA